MMKKILLLFFAAFAVKAGAQSICNDPQGFLVPDIAPQTISSTGGFYEFNAVSGCSYTFSHCSNGGSYTGDTYLRVTDLSNVTIANNDDFCSLGSQLTWNATSTGVFRIHLGVCCGTSVVTCSGGPTRVLAYWSSCAACTTAAPVTVDPVSSQCTSGSFNLSATSTDQISWFDTPNTSLTPLAVGSTYTTPVITSTTTYYAASYDAVNGCFSAPVAVTCVIETPQTIVYNGSVLFCDNGEPVLMNFAPNGGTVSGTATTSNMFDPSVAGAGFHWIYYDLGDACNSNDSVEVEVTTATIDPPIYACEGDLIQVTGSAVGTVAWFDGQSSNSLLDTGVVIDWTLNNTTTIYYGEMPPAFYIDTVTVSNFVISDHNSINGDDRSGVAITNNYFYVVGDGGTARIDADFVGPWVNFPIRDGIFSDLSNGQLYTLWDGVAAPVGTFLGGDYNLNSICPMDEDLNINTAGSIALSQTIVMNNSVSDVGVFAGQGEVVIWTPHNSTFYRIQTSNGNVTVLGTGNISAFTTENWAFWGVSENINGDPCVTYRSNFGSELIRYNINTTTTEVVASFPGGLSDMGCFTIAPWNDRMYFHYEGSTTTFGGSSETAGFTDAQLAYTGGSGGCRTAVDLIISAPTPNLGSDITICSNDPLTLNPGAGFDSYNWSTSATTSTILVSTAGEYFVEVTDSLGCVNSDTINVAVNNVIPVSLGDDISLCDYQIVVLNAGGGYVAYSWNSGQNTQIVSVETDTLAVGANTFTVTATDANGCVVTDDIDIIVLDCASLDESDLNSSVAYPNPVKDNLFIQLNNSSSHVIKVVDLTGKVVMTTMVNDAIMSLDMSEVSDGIYLVQILDETLSVQQSIKITVSK